jgi:hypothetical protein
MFLFLFALLTIVGGWFAWRRNPMYSAGKTVQVVVLFGGTIAIVLGGLIELANLSPSDPPVIYILADIVSLLAGLGLILTVGMRVFNPAPAPLPAGTKLVTVNRRKVIPWLKALLYILLAMGVAALFLGPDGQETVGIFAGILVGFSAFMAMAGYMGGRRLDRALTAVLVNPWVHWTYSRERWEAWTEQQVARMKRNEKKLSYKTVWQAGALFTVLLGVPSLFVLPNNTARIWTLTGICIASALIGFIAVRTQGQTAANYRKRLLAAKPEAFFAPDGLFVESEYSAWVSSEIYLLSAGIEQTNPPCVSMLFERVRPGSAGPQITQIEKRVMIPTHSDADLGILQKNLTALCHKAHVALVEQPKRIG